MNSYFTIFVYFILPLFSGDPPDCARGGGARDLREQVPAQGLHPSRAQAGEGAQTHLHQGQERC